MTKNLGFAGEGAVRQEGPLPIRECKTCGNQIVWATSKRTNKKYPVNVVTGYMDQRFYMKHNFHNCQEVMAEREKWERIEANKALVPAAISEVQARLRAAKANGATEDEITVIFNEGMDILETLQK